MKRYPASRQFLPTWYLLIPPIGLVWLALGLADWRQRRAGR